ncbi:MAG: ATP-binding cassette domain-containing protein [Clostridia bacterium]|nr:ATP-binding cassette domain-containing protein [Clostridia bacterium]
MIELSNVTLGYAHKTVLQSLTFTFPERGVVGVLGSSGVGKTTLFKLLLGRIQPDSGRVSGLAGKRVSVVFQEDRLLSHLSALENVTLVNDGRDALPWLSAMQLREVANEPISALSGGMQRRVAIARALHYGGDILLLDEPFKGLDDALRESILPAIKQAFPLIIVALHEQHEARAFGCDTVLTLH